MKDVFKVFKLRDKMKNKPSQKAFTKLAKLEQDSEIKPVHVSELINEIERASKNAVASLERYKAKHFK
jgi:hypothetical protein